MNYNKNNELKLKKEKNLEKEEEKSEETIIIPNNSCLEEQSFFKTSNINNKKETELSKLSRDIFSNIYKNKAQIDNSIRNYETFLDLQNFPVTSSKLKNKKIIEDFAQRNSYSKNKNNKSNIENSEYEENEYNKKKTIINNNNNKHLKINYNHNHLNHPHFLYKFFKF